MYFSQEKKKKCFKGFKVPVATYILVIQIGLYKNSHFLALDADTERKQSMIQRPSNKKLNKTEEKTGLHISPVQSAKHSEAAQIKAEYKMYSKNKKKKVQRNNLDLKEL